MTNPASWSGKPPLMHITEVSPVMKHAVQSSIPDTFLYDLMTQSERLVKNPETLLQDIAIPRFGIRFTDNTNIVAYKSFLIGEPMAPGVSL